MENNESILDAVIRETLEESGWLVRPTGCIGFYSFTPFAGADTYHRVCLLCEAVALSEQTLDADIISSHWLSLEEIIAHPHRSPLVSRCIEDAQNAPILPLSFICDRFLQPDSTPIK